MMPRNRRSGVTIALSGVMVTTVMALPISPVVRYFALTTPTDYGTHARNAETLLANGIQFPHFLWHALVVAVHLAMPSLSWMGAAKIVVLASYGLQAAVLAWIIITRVVPPQHVGHAFGIALLTLVFVTAAPVTILTWRENGLYFGYLNMESYASPTHAFLKPLALVTFMFTVDGLAERGNRRDGLVLAATSVLSALAKPSLVICLLPATVTMSAWRWLQGRRQAMRYLTLTLVTPSVLVLAWQYSLYYGGGQQRIIFAPLLVMGYYANGLAGKFVMSILLPLTVVLVYRRQALRDPSLQLAWCQFAFAAAYTYLLAESLETLAGNFAWVGQIATYLLFVASGIFALRRRAEWPASAFCLLTFALHAASGALFFANPLEWGQVPSR